MMSSQVLESPVTYTRRGAVTRTYQGPDRREPVALRTQAIALAMDELDHAILLLDRDGRVVHRNYLARVELDDAHPLRIDASELLARNARDAELLQKTLKAAREHGIRRLITVRHGSEQIAVSVVPLTAAAGDDVLTLVMLGKRRIFDELTALSYARCHGLSAAETRIVTGLCNGDAPAELAASAGVKISTVRTQISSIRSKTGSRTVTELVRSIAALPPLIGALRMAGSHYAA